MAHNFFRTSLYRPAMSGRVRPSTGLLFQIQSQTAYASATLAASKILEDINYDGSEDKAPIWCSDLMPNRPPTKESLALRSAIPPNSSIQYLQPRHQDNPLAVTNITDDGYENFVSGGWCVVMNAPTLGSLAQVITAFITAYMGIGQPIRDNGFVHASQKHKYVTRKNRVGANQWDSRFTMKLEVIGVATPQVQHFARQLSSDHAFMTWSGKYSADLLGDFSQHFPCECTSDESINEKWESVQGARLRNAHSGSPPATATIPPNFANGLPRMPAKRWRLC